MGKKIFFLILIFSLTLFFLIEMITLSGGRNNARAQIVVPITNPIGCMTIEACLGKVVDFLFMISVVLAPLMIGVAGFLFITATGNPEKITQARRIITWTLIGFLIILFSKGIVSIITNLVS